MRSVARTSLWAVLVIICILSRPASGGQQAVPGLQVDKSSVGGMVCEQLRRQTGRPAFG